MWILFLVFFALERSNKWDTLFFLLYHKTVIEIFHSEFWLLTWTGTEWQKDRCYCCALISTVLDYFGGEGCSSVKEYLPHTYKGLGLIHRNRKAKLEVVFPSLTYCICLMPVLKQDHRSYWKPGMVAPTGNSSTWEPEVGGWSWVQSQSKLQNENLSQNRNNDIKTLNFLSRVTLVKTCPRRQVPRSADLE